MQVTKSTLGLRVVDLVPTLLIQELFLEDQKATKLDIILCQESALSSDNLAQLLEEAGFKDLVQPRIHGVPKYPPLTRPQFEVWRMAWPITFRDDLTRCALTIAMWSIADGIRVRHVHASYPTLCVFPLIPLSL